MENIDVFSRDRLVKVGAFIDAHQIWSKGGRPANFLPIGDGGICAELDRQYKGVKFGQKALPGFPGHWGAKIELLKSAGQPFFVEDKRKISGRKELLRLEHVGFEPRIAKMYSRATSGGAVEVPYLFPSRFCRWRWNNGNPFRKFTPIIDRAPIVLESIAGAVQWLDVLIWESSSNPSGAGANSQASRDAGERIVEKACCWMRGEEKQPSLLMRNVPELHPGVWGGDQSVLGILAAGSIWWRLESTAAFIRLLGHDPDSVVEGSIEEFEKEVYCDLHQIMRIYDLDFRTGGGVKEFFLALPGVLSATRSLSFLRREWRAFLRGPRIFTLLPDELKPWK